MFVKLLLLLSFACANANIEGYCDGEVVTKTVDFTHNGKGRRYKKGDTPRLLPHGIRIWGRRPQFDYPTANDLLIFNTSDPGRSHKDLGIPGEGLAVIVGETKNRVRPKENRQGGVILMKFRDPVFQVVSLRFLDVEGKDKAQVRGKGVYTRNFPVVRVPPGGHRKATQVYPPSFNNVRSLRISFRGAAALSSMDIAICRQPPVLLPKQSYRSYSGVENKGGSAGSELLRKAPAYYPSDSSGETLGNLNGGYPNARDVSNKCSAQRGWKNNRRGLSDMVWAFGQFLDHDLDLSPPDESAGDVTVEIGNPKDPLYPGIPMKRSVHSASTNGKPREQVNIITASIDGSVIYGSDEERAHALRTFKNGMMKTSGKSSDPRQQLLPLFDPKSGLENEGADRNVTLFIGGDVRVNEQLTLTAFHILFVREHNWLARKIRKHEPTATDEEIYQKARKIVTAEINKITYTEFLPSLMGKKGAPKFNGHNSDIDISITNEFAGAAYRFGHSLLSPNLRLAIGGQTKFISLRHAFFRSSFLTNNPRRVDYILGGLAKQKAQELDLNLIDDVRNFLFGSPGDGGMDLAALNIQRGRDHGLPLYNAARKAYGLPPVHSFAGVTKNRQTRRCLLSMYGNPSKMDLWVAALAEDHIPGSSMGPLLTAILRDQFSRLMHGDVFYYGNDPEMQSPAMKRIVDVDQVKLSDIIRRNTRAQIKKGSNVFFVAENH